MAEHSREIEWNRMVVPAGMPEECTSRGFVPSPYSCPQGLRPLECCVEPPQDADSTFSSLSWKGKACLGTDERSELGETSGTSISTPMLRFRRASEVDNLDLSLLPSLHSSELFCAPGKADKANQSLLQSPFPGFHSPNCEGIYPVFRSPTTQDNQHQRQDRQLTIFYAGTVNVYEVSPDLAEAIMALANSESNSTSSFTHQIPTNTCPAKMSPVDHTDQSHSVTPKPANFPFSRQNSLQRFLEKRNDRINAKTAGHSHLHHN
ncbi:hypothetical protein SUGI_1147070 [Cryptomeria japonica]|uniref:protein TIFY 10b n=1 Tax=Cryptomeria japonica TaxID=3369 RepID=UPI002414C9F8|nr:protein TIFY 10b [Cryptomeria japonica]GLJ53754.1 hypothetical protein SUGI_1147070 [Cryptomeria japonica]